MHFNARRRSLIAMSSFAAYRKPGTRDDNGDTGNANAGGGGGTGTGSGQGGNTGGSGQQGGQSGGQQSGQGNGQSGTGEPQLVEQLPGWTQRLISDLRRQAAGKRVADKNSDGDGNQGTVAGNGQQQGSPGGTQQQNNQSNTDATKNDDAETRAQAAEIKSAVLMAAVKVGANPIALTDSISFLNDVSGLDPNDEKAFAEAIKKAIEKNPALKAVQAAGRSGGEFTGGPGAGATKDVGTGVDRLRHAYAANQQT